MTAVLSLMDRLLDLSKNSICPSMIRKLKVIVYFRKVFLLSKFKYHEQIFGYQYRRKNRTAYRYEDFVLYNALILTHDHVTYHVTRR